MFALVVLALALSLANLVFLAALSFRLSGACAAETPSAAGSGLEAKHDTAQDASSGAPSYGLHHPTAEMLKRAEAARLATRRTALLDPYADARGVYDSPD